MAAKKVQVSELHAHFREHSGCIRMVVESDGKRYASVTDILENILRCARCTAHRLSLSITEKLHLSRKTYRNAKNVFFASTEDVPRVITLALEEFNTKGVLSSVFADSQFALVPEELKDVLEAVQIREGDGMRNGGVKIGYLLCDYYVLERDCNVTLKFKAVRYPNGSLFVSCNDILRVIFGIKDAMVSKAYRERCVIGLCIKMATLQDGDTDMVAMDDVKRFTEAAMEMMLCEEGEAEIDDLAGNSFKFQGILRRARFVEVEKRKRKRKRADRRTDGGNAPDQPGTEGVFRSFMEEIQTEMKRMREDLVVVIKEEMSKFVSSV